LPIRHRTSSGWPQNGHRMLKTGSHKLNDSACRSALTLGQVLCYKPPPFCVSPCVD
jgi:hypothetical protein